MSKYIKISNIRLLLHQMEVEIVVKKKKNTCRKKQKPAKREAKKRNTTHTHPTDCLAHLYKTDLFLQAGLRRTIQSPQRYRKR